VTDINGDWWAVFLATRPYDLNKGPVNPGYFHTGRETFVAPVTWKEGWPIILEKDTVLPRRLSLPMLDRSSPQARPITGNFSFRDDFSARVLDHHWLFIRTPMQKWWLIEKDQLFIRPRNISFSDKSNPSAIIRRVQHMHATVTTRMEFDPTYGEAGLVAIQNDDHYYTFGLSSDTFGKLILKVKHRNGTEDLEHGSILAEMQVSIPSGREIFLRIDINKSDIDFAYSINGEAFISVLDNADSKTLTTAVAGGFTGATIGMYAIANE